MRHRSNTISVRQRARVTQRERAMTTTGMKLSSLWRLSARAMGGNARARARPGRALARARANDDSRASTREDARDDAVRIALGTSWVSLGAIAMTIAPQGTSASDVELVLELVRAPFSPGESNAIFEAVFNALGVIPATYASVLMPGARGQRVPAAPFIGASFALGFFALGPYLIARERRNETTRKSDCGFVTRNIWESKVNAFALVAFATWLLYYGASNASAEVVREFGTLVRERSMLACVSTCDFVVLSLAMADAIGEDMRRRDVDPANALAFASLPVLGPALWLLARPELED